MRRVEGPGRATSGASQFDPQHVGTSLEDFLREDVTLKEVNKAARRRLIAHLAAGAQAEPPAPPRIESVTERGGRWCVSVRLGGTRSHLRFSSESAARAAVAALQAAGATVRTQKRGFAAMDGEQHRQLASAGGRAVQATGRAHRWTAEEARAQGEAGGAVVRERFGKEHFRELGRRGGKAWADARRAACAKKS